MINDNINNIHIVSETILPTPEKIKQQLPLSDKASAFICNSRESIKKILDRKDKRLLVVVGPCSIHNITSGLEYAEKLKALSNELSETMQIVMRVYFEKPRTTIGWKGFINDPNLDDSFHIEEGLYKAREFLLKLADMEIMSATEVLDPITPQYIGDLISWTAVGARTTESQTHREIASGLSTPVGFKNGTEGNVDVAINAIESVSHPHHFLGITRAGQCAVFHTEGNTYGHLVLRGGNKPNYDPKSISDATRALDKAGLDPNIMIDCSHGNSGKDPSKQAMVLNSCVKQILNGNKSIIGVMIESNLEEGQQVLMDDITKLNPRISITDGCIGWNETATILQNTADKLSSSPKTSEDFVARS